MNRLFWISIGLLGLAWAPTAFAGVIIQGEGRCETGFLDDFRQCAPAGIEEGASISFTVVLNVDSLPVSGQLLEAAVDSWSITFGEITADSDEIENWGFFLTTGGDREVTFLTLLGSLGPATEPSVLAPVFDLRNDAAFFAPLGRCTDFDGNSLPCADAFIFDAEDSAGMDAPNAAGPISSFVVSSTSVPDPRGVFMLLFGIALVVHRSRRLTPNAMDALPGPAAGYASPRPR